MSVSVQFCGAARTVTGSCCLFKTQAGQLLVDCGLFQGPKTLKALNYGAFPFRPRGIDSVLLTHAKNWLKRVRIPMPMTISGITIGI